MRDFSEFLVPASTVPSARIVDVTLRDGGFQTNFDWTVDEICSLAASVSRAGAEYVELGYVGGVPELHNAGEAGRCAHLDAALIEKVHTAVPTAKLAVMVHPSAAKGIINFAQLKAAGVEMVRFVFNERWASQFAALASSAKTSGLFVAANIALASRYEVDEFNAVVQSLTGVDPDIVYIADTCAGLLPSEVPALVKTVSRHFQVGFHAHDFLSLGLANALSALEAGAAWIDASVYGIGRGAGNLRIELWLALLSRVQPQKDALSELLPALAVVERKVGVPKIPDLPSIVSGALNLTPPQEDELRAVAKELSIAPSEGAARLSSEYIGKKSVRAAMEQPHGSR